MIRNKNKTTLEKTIYLKFILFFGIFRIMNAHRMFFVSIIFVYLVYGLVFVGFLSAVPKYVYIWNFLVQLTLCLFLLIRYHPFRSSYTFDSYDAKLIFSAVFLLLLNLITIPVLISQWNHFTFMSGLREWIPEVKNSPIKMMSLPAVLQ